MADDNAHISAPPLLAPRRKAPKNPLGKFAGKAVTWLVAAIVIAGLAFGAWTMFKPKDDADPYRFGTVERGDVTKTVSASGTLEARETVNVGSQLSVWSAASMPISTTRVKKGQLLAKIDPRPSSPASTRRPPA